MFDYCIWLQLKKDHPINKITPHKAHFTLEYNLTLREALKNVAKYQPFSLFKVGKVYKNSFKNFYSIEQEYQDRNRRIYHISLKYQVDKDFDKIPELDLPDVIRKEEVLISIWNCNSPHYQDWYPVT